MDTLYSFANLSGLVINVEKTNCFKIGQGRLNHDNTKTKYIINWSDGPIETLGIKIPINDRNQICQINYDPQIKEMELQFNRWGNRRLSLRGKATIIKTYGTSKLTYLASLLPNPPTSIIHKINQIIFNFMWNGKGDKIKRDIMTTNYDEGGLNIPDFQTVCTSQKITWVKRYVDSNIKNSQWGKLIDYVYKHVGGKFIFRCNTSMEEVKTLTIRSQFWKHVLISWCSYNFERDIKENKIQSQIIWLNSNIHVDRQTLYNKECVENNLWKIEQIYEQNILLDRNMINIIYDINLTQMQYNSMISAIPREWRKYMKENVNNHVKNNENKYESITKLKQTLVSKHAYRELIDRNFEGVKLDKKWAQYFNTANLDKSLWFKHINNITIDNVLRSFQFKVLHRIIYFNDKLFLFKVSNETSCDFCNETSDSIEHRFWECRKVQELWKDIIKWYSELTESQITLSYKEIISNLCGDNLLNFVVLYTKYYIYKCFLAKNDLSIHKLTCEIKYMEIIEKDIALRRNKIHKHIDKWTILTTYTH